MKKTYIQLELAMELKNWFRILHTGLLMATKIRFLTLYFMVALSSFAQAEGVGFVRQNFNGQALLFTTENIPTNKQIEVQYPGENGKAKCCKRTRVKYIKEKQTEVSNQESEKPVHVYGLAYRYDAPFVGIGLIGTRKHHAIGPNEISYGKTGTAKLCFSQEGAHLVSTASNNIKSHLYMSLGYDIEPTCNANEQW